MEFATKLQRKDKVSMHKRGGKLYMKSRKFSVLYGSRSVPRRVGIVSQVETDKCQRCTNGVLKQGCGYSKILRVLN